LDASGNHKLECEEFRSGLGDFGICISAEEAQEMMKRLDSNHDGCVDFKEFLRFLKGDLNAARVDVIRRAYAKLDANGDGTVKLDDIAQLYDASKHPEVHANRKSERAVFMEFMSLWDTQEQDGIVTFDEFCQYYSDISCLVESDEEFCAIICAAWKLD